MEEQGHLVAETILSLRYADLQTSSFLGAARDSLSGTVVPISSTVGEPNCFAIAVG